MKRKILNFDRPYTPKTETWEYFEDSIFKNPYQRACRFINEICHDSDRIRENSEMAKDYIYNLIPIIGDRGSGKTSVLLSLIKYMKGYDPEKNYKNLSKNYSLENNNFIVLDRIDAGLFEDNEDLFGVVLARMLAYYNRNTDNEKSDFSAKIYQDFSRIYNDFSKISSMRDGSYYDSGSALSVLSAFDASQNLRDAFRDLVYSFLSLVSGRNSYIVVSIDDIDMNVRNAHKMLEQIQTYMMIPGVIIFITASYDNLMCICQNYYTSHFKEVIHASARSENYLGRKFIESCEELSHEYLNKLLPTGRMIHLRQAYQYDLCVDIVNSDINELFKIEKTTNNKTGDEKNVYQFGQVIAAKLFQCTDIQFYIGEKDGIFLEPVSIRSKGQYINKIKSMQIPKHHTDRIHKRAISHNITFLLDDIAVRYIGTFSENQRRSLKDLAKTRLKDFSLRTYRIVSGIILRYSEVNYGKQSRTPSGVSSLLAKRDIKMGGEEIVDISRKFDDVIYHLDRLNDVASDSYKDFIEAVLGLFTVKLYEEYFYIKTDNHIDNDREWEVKTKIGLVRKYIGSSIFGKLDKAICSKAIMGENILSEDRRLKMYINMGHVDILSDISQWRISLSGYNTEANVKDIMKRIHAFAVFYLFLSSDQVEVNLYENELYFDFTGDMGFSLSSYFINICDRKRMRAFYEKIKSAIKTSNSSKIKLIEAECNLIEFINDNSNTVSMPLPLMNLELLYNILYNIRAKYSNNPVSMGAWKTVCEYFRKIGDELKNIDAMYKNMYIYNLVGSDKDKRKYSTDIYENNLYKNYERFIPSYEKTNEEDNKKDNENKFAYLDNDEIEYFEELIKVIRWSEVG